MGIDATSLVGGALGGAALQSVLDPLLGQRHLRRDLRANVVRAVARVEERRWATARQESFGEAVIELRTAALVAGLQREPMEAYVEIASGARALAERTAIRHDNEPALRGGLIPTEMGDLAQHAATLLVSIAWHPYRTRPLIRFRLASLESEKRLVTAELNENRETRLDWDRVWTPQ
jgi:hypothetical protein